MEILGFGLVALCMFVGTLIGRILGSLLGVEGDVGGVGFAMILLIFITNYYEGRGKEISQKTKNGILLLSALYIPVVVAMSSIQNVVAAFAGGAVAFLAGGVATIGALFLVPLISKFVPQEEEI